MSARHASVYRPRRNVKSDSPSRKLYPFPNGRQRRPHFSALLDRPSARSQRSTTHAEPRVGHPNLGAATRTPVPLCSVVRCCPRTVLGATQDQSRGSAAHRPSFHLTVTHRQRPAASDTVVFSTGLVRRKIAGGRLEPEVGSSTESLWILANHFANMHRACQRSASHAVMFGDSRP